MIVDAKLSNLEIVKAYQAGKEAAELEKPRTRNPFNTHYPLSSVWEAGWDDAVERMKNQARLADLGLTDELKIGEA